MFKRNWMFAVLLLLSFNSNAATDSLDHLPQAYPNYIKNITSKYIVWQDGTRMLIEGSFPLLDKFAGLFYRVDSSVGSVTQRDQDREHYEYVFRKMYGDSAKEVRRNLVTIYWMPHVFGNRYPLKVTAVNGVAERLRRISAELEKLPPSYYKYLENPAGSFYWRRVEGESYLSTHSFGIALDINVHYTNYWLWDYQRYGRPVSELTPQNRIPMRIVDIFEKEGFFWGGRWRYYDTMHFEYRPDLLM